MYKMLSKSYKNVRNNVGLEHDPNAMLAISTSSKFLDIYNYLSIEINPMKRTENQSYEAKRDLLNLFAKDFYFILFVCKIGLANMLLAFQHSNFGNL
jgi:hypothetical protein